MINIGSKVGGFFREFRVYNVDTGKTRVIKGPKNLVVDTGLDMFWNNKQGLNMCLLSTNNTPPDVSDLVAGGTTVSTDTKTAVLVGQATTAPYWTGKEISYVFALGAAAGNWSSIAIGVNGTSSNLFARALIVDGSGNPATLTVAANEILTVVYQLRIYCPMEDGVQQVTVNSVEYEMICRAAYFLSWRGVVSNFTLGSNFNTARIFGPSSNLGPVTGSPSGAGASVSYTHTYDSDEKAILTTVTASYSTANIQGGYGALLLYHGSQNALGNHGYQMKFTPPLPKDNTKNFSMTVKHSWGRW